MPYPPAHGGVVLRLLSVPEVARPTLADVHRAVLRRDEEEMREGLG